MSTIKPTHTPLQNFRCAQDPWDAAVARSKTEGTSLSAILRQVVEDYAAGKPVRIPAAARKVEGSLT